jgi:hypothetical protein
MGFKRPRDGGRVAAEYFEEYAKDFADLTSVRSEKKEKQPGATELLTTLDKGLRKTNGL